MSAEEVERKLLSLLKASKPSEGLAPTLSITFNEHHINYWDAKEGEKHDEFDAGDWVSEEEHKKAVETDSVWCLHYYPRTPVSFSAFYGSTLKSVLDAAVANEA